MIGIVAIVFTLKPIPKVIKLDDFLVPGNHFYDLIHHILVLFREITVDFLALMILKRQRKLFELLDKSFGDRERTALNFAVDLGNPDAELLFQIVASLCLTLVI